MIVNFMICESFGISFGSNSRLSLEPDYDDFLWKGRAAKEIIWQTHRVSSG